MAFHCGCGLSPDIADRHDHFDPRLPVFLLKAPPLLPTSISYIKIHCTPSSPFHARKDLTNQLRWKVVVGAACDPLSTPQAYLIQVQEMMIQRHQPVSWKGRAENLGSGSPWNCQAFLEVCLKCQRSVIRGTKSSNDLLV